MYSDPFRLTNDKIYLIQETSSVTTDCVFWCDIVTSNFFDYLVLDGVSADGMPGKEIILRMYSSGGSLVELEFQNFLQKTSWKRSDSIRAK